jgi:hypothetical protein
MIMQAQEGVAKGRSANTFYSARPSWFFSYWSYPCNNAPHNIYHAHLMFENSRWIIVISKSGLHIMCILLVGHWLSNFSGIYLPLLTYACIHPISIEHMWLRWQILRLTSDEVNTCALIMRNTSCIAKKIATLNLKINP